MQLPYLAQLDTARLDHTEQDIPMKHEHQPLLRTSLAQPWITANASDALGINGQELDLLLSRTNPRASRITYSHDHRANRHATALEQQQIQGKQTYTKKRQDACEA